MAGYEEIVKVEITPIYSTTGSGTVPCGYVRTTYIRRY